MCVYVQKKFYNILLKYTYIHTFYGDKFILIEYCCIFKRCNTSYCLIKKWHFKWNFQTITKASLPQNKNGYWSIIVWTMSSRWGLICSNRPISLNSIGNKVGHQHMARFLESMLFSLQFSETLEKIMNR